MGRKVTVWFNEEDLHATAFLFKTHRDWIQSQFRKVNVEVTKFHHDYDQFGKRTIPGVIVGRGDSDLDKRISMTVEIGVNAREIDAERDKV